MNDVPFKRFLVFGCDYYYPSGGLGDVIGSFDTLEEAKEAINRSRRDWHEVLDLQERVPAAT